MIEREIKLAAEVGVVLPDLSDVVRGVTVRRASVLHLDAIYYDTPTLSLARWGVTLRSRSGEDGPVWTLKLPITTDEAELARHELTFDDPVGPIPVAVRRATRALTRRQALGPAVRLHTERTQLAVELDGRPLATVCDDVVVADGAVEPINVFREVEVELADPPCDDPAATNAIMAIVSRLRRAGCRDDEPPVPKAIRALGPRAFDAPDVIILKIGRNATVGAVVRHSISTSVAQLIGQHAKVCQGDDPEALHQFRVASRRLRSDLRTFAPLLDVHWMKWLREELAWVGNEVGVGRDADVLAARLRSQLDRLPDRDSKAVDHLLRRLEDTAADAAQRVLTMFDDDRYVELLDALVDAASNPRLANDPSGLADRAARPVFFEIVHKPWRRLHRAVDALDSNAPDAAYHAVRILAKRARYAADAVTALYGKDARRFAAAMADVQTVLGKIQDTTVAEAWLREAAKALPSTRLVAGELIGFERDDRQKLRARFWKVWKKASRRKLLAWLR